MSSSVYGSALRRVAAASLFVVIGCLSWVDSQSSAFSCEEGTVPTESLQIGDKFVLCILTSLPTSNKMSFEVTVDAYSSLLLRGSGAASESFLSQQSDSSKVYLWASAGGSDASPLNCEISRCNSSVDCENNSTSCPQTYMTNDLVVPYVNLQLVLAKGLLTTFQWVNGCFTDCDDASCVKSPGSVSFNGPVAVAESGDGVPEASMCGTLRSSDACKDPEACPVVVFVTWEGTDRRGRRLSSGSLAYGWLRSKNLASPFKTVTSLFE